MPDVPFVGMAKLSFPMKVGVSLDGYYTDDVGGNDNIGYFSVGAKTAFPLPVPAKYGTWSLTTGLEYLYLGSSSLRVANGSEGNVFIGRVGIDVAY